MSSFWARPIKITYPSQIHLIKHLKHGIFDHVKVENYRKCPALLLQIPCEDKYFSQDITLQLNFSTKPDCRDFSNKFSSRAQLDLLATVASGHLSSLFNSRHILQSRIFTRIFKQRVASRIFARILKKT